MPYNPGQTYVGGQLLQRGFEDFGDHLVQAFDRYEKHSQAIHQFDAVRDMLTNTAGPDGKPWLDPKAAERLAHYSGREKAAVGGGVMNMMDLLTRMGVSGAKSQLLQQTLNEPFVKVDGQLYRRPGAPMPVTTGATAGQQAVEERFRKREAAKQARFAITDAQKEQKQIKTDFGKALLNQGLDPAIGLEDFMHPNVIPGIKQPERPGGFAGTGLFKGEEVFTPSDQNPTHYKLPGGQVIEKQIYDTLRPKAKRHKELQGIIEGRGAVATPGAGGPIVNVKTVEEASKLAPGTRYRAPDGRVRIIPQTTTTTSAATDEAEITDNTDEEEEE